MQRGVKKSACCLTFHSTPASSSSLCWSVRCRRTLGPGRRARAAAFDLSFQANGSKTSCLLRQLVAIKFQAIASRARKLLRLGFSPIAKWTIDSQHDCPVCQSHSIGKPLGRGPFHHSFKTTAKIPSTASLDRQPPNSAPASYDLSGYRPPSSGLHP